jgi:L-cysteine:1D-myo-inositol 2-amino-2-deoxy-alpha-D-glucopyranoside ligase
MRLFDTLQNHKVDLTIPTDRPLTLYVCGVTPYDTTHIGHAHTFLIFDLLIRHLRYRGAEVAYCQNVTDVDDPLFERANRDGVDWRWLAQQQTEQFVKDSQALNILPPTYYPKASEEIPHMLPIIETLIAKGHAYERHGSVYFSIKTNPSYGAMARMSYDELLAVANQRGNNPNDPNKRDPLDFVLWTAAKPGEAAWESPWGMGRPGWHIECTTMATRYLGDQIDIHGGGRDLIFPHHPSEIAQTECYTDKHPFVRFWLHGGMVYLDGEKMSKSLGNMVFARDALREHSADALRWYLLSFPYRDDFSYEKREVIETEQKIASLQAALIAKSGGGSELDITDDREHFLAALNDDLQSPIALSHLDAISTHILRAAAANRTVTQAQATLRELAGIFGFWAVQ